MSNVLHHLNTAPKSHSRCPVRKRINVGRSYPARVTQVLVHTYAKMFQSILRWMQSEHRFVLESPLQIHTRSEEGNLVMIHRIDNRQPYPIYSQLKN